MLHAYGNRGVSFERHLARNKLVQKNAERIDICSGSSLLSLEAFGRHISRGAIHFAGSRYRGGCQVDRIEAAIKKMRDTKIDKIDSSLLIE